MAPVIQVEYLRRNNDHQSCTLSILVETLTADHAGKVPLGILFPDMQVEYPIGAINPSHVG
jgi:hypothetical protein